MRPANYLRTQPGRGTAVVERDGTSLGVVNLSGNLFMRAGSPAFTAVDDGAARGRGRRARARRHARRGDEREGRARLVPRRPRDRGRRHPHARPDRRRARAAERHRLHHRRRHDRRARRRDRRRREQSIATMRTHMPMRFDVADEDPWLNAVVIRCSAPRPGRRDRAGPAPRRGGVGVGDRPRAEALRTERLVLEPLRRRARRRARVAVLDDRALHAFMGGGPDCCRRAHRAREAPRGRVSRTEARAGSTG